MRIPGAVGLTLLALVAGCGTTYEQPQGSMDRPATFTHRLVTWAQGSTIHYGARTFTLGDEGTIEAMWRTSYAFVVRLRPAGDSSPRYLVVDREGSTSLRGRPGSLHVSPDGRYAGYIDFGGPHTSTGDRAAAVVVDLHTGREVLRDDQQMGGKDDDLADLYEDAEVSFLGFDDRYAYWDTPVGKHQVKRARIGTWEVEDGGRQSELGEVPVGDPYDRLTGRPVGIGDDGRPAPAGQGYTGFRSPEGRWCLATGGEGRLRVTDCRTGRERTPAYPGRFAFFGGWQDADTFYVLARQDFDGSVQQGAADATRGVIASCSLRTRTCRPVTDVRRTGSLVFAIGRGYLDV